MIKYKLELTKYETVALKDILGKFNGSIDSGDKRFDDTLRRIEYKVLSLLKQGQRAMEKKPNWKKECEPYESYHTKMISFIADGISCGVK